MVITGVRKRVFPLRTTPEVYPFLMTNSRDDGGTEDITSLRG